MTTDNRPATAELLDAATRSADDTSLFATIQQVLKPFGSLKLTVTLLAMSIFIVLAGTLAQAEVSTRQAVDDYFRVDCRSLVDFFGTCFAWIKFQIFFPPSFFPSKPQIPGGIPFPKGWLIGFAMVINLLAAHSLRYKVLVRGPRLVWGIVTAFAGLFAIYVVIASGSNQDGFQGLPLLSWSHMWILFLCGLTAASIACLAAVSTVLFTPNRRAESYLVLVLGLIAGAVAAWLWIQYFRHGDAYRLNDSSMRILWQLAKATAAATVLLIGCILLFKKRGGVLLLHVGVLLLMFGELLVGISAREGQMRIAEGQTANYTFAVDQLELAVIDRTAEDHDKVVSIPQSRLKRGIVEHPELPFDVELLDYLPNSTIKRVTPGKSVKNPADAGIGQGWVAVELPPNSGATSGGAVDVASAYVRFTAKNGKPLGTYLLSQLFSFQDMAERVSVDGKSYDVYLRSKRDYKPYAIHLIDVRKQDYAGTDTPRDYRSIVRLTDGDRSVDRKIPIWMNNPMRYAGETFYQSGYQRDPRTGVEVTTLAVVTNMGWMIPYTACMIVAVGMIAHFHVILMRFLHRRTVSDAARFAGAAEGVGRDMSSAAAMGSPGGASAKNAAAAVPPLDAELVESPAMRVAGVLVPLIVVLVFGGWLLSKAMPPRVENEELNLVDFGKLPIVYQGRVKPVDTLARNSLRIISERETFKDQDGKRQPAIRWFLDVVARPDVAYEHPVFRIHDGEVLGSLDLEPRAGHWYSTEEILNKMDEFQKQVSLARKAGDASELDRYQRNILDLERKIGVLDLIIQSYIRPTIRPGKALEDLRVFMDRHPPRMIPPEEGSDQWQCYSIARMLGASESDPATESMSRILAAYSRIKPLPDEPPSGEATPADADRAQIAQSNREAVREFNREVAKYRRYLTANAADQINLTKTDFEAYFNHFHPFFYASWVYLVAFLFALFGWLGWARPLNRAAFWLMVVTLLVHTFALIARIYISGRPPVTNLYSSAVFIGWGCVVFGLIYEMIYRNGVGNTVAGISGFLALQIAYRLSGDGDTFVVLQAVLDTQFWLATHVVMITLGYSATFVAGLLGILYVLKGILTPNLVVPERKELTRMIYGTLCFAIFFSFVGTVLGGLWADDSWGRFWGWDPKENGALIIVLWNAIVLHARWGALVKERGLALLAVAGNICTAWSWFGVNELGVGLHSYGFTKGVLLALLLFALFNLAVIALGCIPQRYWWSVQRHGLSTPAAS